MATVRMDVETTGDATAAPDIVCVEAVAPEGDSNEVRPISVMALVPSSATTSCHWSMCALSVSPKPRASRIAVPL